MPNQTGPTSITGRLTSCMNHFKHGGTSESLFIQGENPEDFFALLENAFEQRQPAFDQDAILVTRSVRANWILTRRERAAETYEAALYARKPDPTYIVPADLHELNLFDRYKTTAHRAFTRSLKDLQLIQKMAHDDQRWQCQLESQKQKLAIEVERFELVRQKEARAAAQRAAEKAAEDETQACLDYLADLKKEVKVDEEHGSYIPQAVYAAFDEDGATIASEASPKNHTVRNIIARAAQFPTPPTKIVRTYHFKGSVPPEYQWLLTEDWQRYADYQEIRKPFTFEEWNQLAGNE